MKESPFIEQIVLVGDNKKMVTALVVPSFAKLKDWAKQNGVEYTSNEAIIKDEKVLTLFETVVARVQSIIQSSRASEKIHFNTKRVYD